MIFWPVPNRPLKVNFLCRQILVLYKILNWCVKKCIASELHSKQFLRVWYIVVLVIQMSCWFFSNLVYYFMCWQGAFLKTQFITKSSSASYHHHHQTKSPHFVRSKSRGWHKQTETFFVVDNKQSQYQTHTNTVT